MYNYNVLNFLCGSLHVLLRISIILKRSPTKLIYSSYEFGTFKKVFHTQNIVTVAIRYSTHLQSSFSKTIIHTIMHEMANAVTITDTLTSLLIYETNTPVFQYTLIQSSQFRLISEFFHLHRITLQTRTKQNCYISFNDVYIVKVCIKS